MPTDPKQSQVPARRRTSGYHARRRMRSVAALASDEALDAALVPHWTRRLMVDPMTEDIECVSCGVLVWPRNGSATG